MPKMLNEVRMDIMGPDDTDNYLGLFNDLKAEKKIPEGAVLDHITQLMHLDGSYLGGWIVVYGRHEEGSDEYDDADPVYRYWIWVSKDWERELIYDSIGSLYDQAIKEGAVVSKRHAYYRDGKKFICETTQTLDLSRWRQHSGTA